MTRVLGRPAPPPQPLFLAQLNPGVRMFSMGTPRGIASDSDSEETLEGMRQHFIGTPLGSSPASTTSSRCSSQAATAREGGADSSAQCWQSVTTGSTRSCTSIGGDTRSGKKVHHSMTGGSAQTSRSSSVSSCSYVHRVLNDSPAPTPNELLAAVMNSYAHLQGPADADALAELEVELDFPDIDL